MPLKTQRIIVIGAGIGGLTAALELAHNGFDVTVVESAAAPGGKMRTLPSPAGPVDAGPTVFTMPWVFEQLFDSLGESLEEHLTLHPLGIIARHHWRGAPTLDLFADAAHSREAIGTAFGGRAARQFDRFNARARRLFDAVRDPVMTAADPTPLSVTRATLPRAGGLLRDMAPHRSFAGMLDHGFSDPRLRQLFGRYATYVGGSPYLSPGILALIWHAEASGVSCVAGGMNAVARALESMAKARGVTFRYRSTARRIRLADGRAAHVELADGEVLDAASVLFNGDPAALADGLLGDDIRPATPPRPRGKRSLSAWVWTFAADPGAAPLTHHNVCFSDDPRAEFDELFRIGRRPKDPTLYVCAQDRLAADAPGGPERFQIIMNAPANGDVITPTDQEIRQCETMVFNRLAEAGLHLSPPEAENALTTPWDFATLFPGTGGAIYGTSPHGMMATFRRPRARSALPGLYLAGGAVHPGPGVPMAALSGRQAAAAIMADRASISMSRRTAMPGGTSTDSRTTASAVSRSSAS
ncbi:1-hydroxycarotenoid 3,4-desaturase CrtD [Oceanibium sediminis]|uniref:1-hydroxycarotenoid 3,4-desaturase CrtD n=1 Tax=Oceanibium sediminis TaxID=2026339 RepID=UPI001E5A635F|nr:1-hydroxycarotenoid 3,4-desaturase CrtD [Oceanibium sediminis]